MNGKDRITFESEGAPGTPYAIWMSAVGSGFLAFRDPTWVHIAVITSRDACTNSAGPSSSPDLAAPVPLLPIRPVMRDPPDIPVIEGPTRPLVVVQRATNTPPSACEWSIPIIFRIFCSQSLPTT